MLTPEEMYQDGQAFAREVQDGLKQGKSFDDLIAFPPDHAANIRDLWQQESEHQDMYQWWKGYVSRWD